MRWLPIHEIVNIIRQEKSNAIRFFHAFTGCDIVSAFRGKGKKTAWQTWSVFPRASDTFSKLSKYPTIIKENDQKILESFVITMYDRSSNAISVDEARFDLFARKQRSYESIPPTHAALLEHIKRATFQAGCIWGQALVCNMENENPNDWGWMKQNDVWAVVWTKLAPVAQSCSQLTKCGCRTECRGRCKCFRFGLACTALCSCSCET